MSENGNQTTYGLQGVYIPWYQVEAPDGAEGEDDDLPRLGFMLSNVLRKRAYIVQSNANKKLYFVKRVEGVENPEFPYEFSHLHPPEFRVSTDPYALFRLPIMPQFPKLEWYQRYLDGDRRIWELYFEYLNGGSLAQLRDKYYRERKRVPEQFIWHVASELCKALLFCHQGHIYEVQPATPGFRRIFHRDISMDNIMLDYEPRYGGRRPAAGNWRNAFPRVVLCNFGESAVEGDDPANLQKGQFEFEVQPNLWEDLYELGCVLRSLCMTHVPLPEDEALPANRVPIPDQFKDESQGWAHRPDSRRLDDVNAYPVGQPYSEALIRLLKEFEWDDQEHDDINEPGKREACVPNTDFVYEALFTSARYEVGYARYFDPKPAGFFDSIDVSWTRPWGPMPYAVNEDKIDRSIRRIEKAIRRTDYEFCGLEMRALARYRPLAGPP